MNRNPPPEEEAAHLDVETPETDRDVGRRSAKVEAAEERGNTLDLGVIGNSVTAALVDKRGRIVWFCFPRLDGDPIFCSLLNVRGVDRESGFFDVEVEDFATARQSYRRNTAILETLVTDRSGGQVQIIDYMPRFMHYERPFRPPILVRHVSPVVGSPRIRIRLRPRFNYGSDEPEIFLGSNHLRYHTPKISLRLETDAPVAYVAEELPFVLEQPVNLIFGQDEDFDAPITETAQRYLINTEAYWKDWVRDLSIPFEWQEAVIRAAITLKLCSFEETGAIAAALTTSIPESPDCGRNWDYRYCWLRDAYFVVQALNRLGSTGSMEQFIHYITNIAAFGKHVRLDPVYGIIPRSTLTERNVDGLAGYRGMVPVRVGNAAANQIQNDVYGSVVLASAQMFFDRRLPNIGGKALFERLEELGEWARLAAFEPDASLWEYRGRERIHTYSSVMCWAACDRLAAAAGILDLPDRSDYWWKEAVRIRTRIMEEGWDEEGNTFVESFGGRSVDASLLLLHEVGFVAADDPRFLGTLAAIETRLRHDKHIYRYEEADDFGEPTTAFNVCTFWFINALVAVGRTKEARGMFEEVLACCTPLGLLSEDIDPQSKELWGNFPQSYSMVGLIVSATRLSQTWEEAFWRGTKRSG